MMVSSIQLQLTFTPTYTASFFSLYKKDSFQMEKEKKKPTKKKQMSKNPDERPTVGLQLHLTLNPRSSHW